MGTFDDRVVLVTGGGTGIGRALAAAFHREGARVAIASRDPEHLKQAALVITARAGAGAEDPHARLLPLRLDVRVREAAESVASRVADTWGRIDILINNAGISGITPIDAGGETAEARWHDILATNLTGVYFMTRACLPHMKEGGRILNIASVLGKFGVAGYTAYCSAKHGVIGFTRALAGELAPRKITVNALCPGWVDTAMAETGVRESAERLGISREAFKKAAMERVPLARFIRPEEVALLALYLVSPQAEAVTGQAINIEGGATTW